MIDRQMFFPKNLDMEFDDPVKAFEQAELYTKLGFEVTAPQSFDGGQTFSFQVIK